MKNKYIASYLLVAIVILSGCTDSATSRDKLSGLDIYTDNDTGCQYVFKKSGYSGGMAARISSDGVTHFGCGS